MACIIGFHQRRYFDVGISLVGIQITEAQHILADQLPVVEVGFPDLELFEQIGFRGQDITGNIHFSGPVLLTLDNLETDGNAFFPHVDPGIRHLDIDEPVIFIQGFNSQHIIGQLTFIQISR